MDVDSMKYAELQKLAKELGLKANMKADKLLKLIKQHYQQEKSEEDEEEVERGQVKDTAAVQEGSAGRDGAEENPDAVPSASVFVNTRRGRGNCTKRKISDTECDAKLTSSAAEDVTEVEARAPSRGARGAKKRKMSAVKDKDGETELPEEPRVTVSSEQHQQETDVQDETGKSAALAKAGKIPRLQGLLQKKKQLKPVTPNFKKLHEAHFNKMESIDSYVQRKNRQMETYRTSVKELKKLSDKTKLQQLDNKTQTLRLAPAPRDPRVEDKAKVNQSHASMFSPVAVGKKPSEDKRRHTLLSASQAAGKEDAPFRPSVLSTRRINVRFSEATRDNEYKRSLAKTPARMSPCVASSTPLREASAAVKPSSVRVSTFSATKTPGTFVFTGNTSASTTPGTQKKLSFDLKASLSRPLSYKPHKGKLKPYGDAKENPAVTANKSLISNSHQKNYKQHQVQTREDRREKHAADRKQKKQSLLGARRGLVMM